MTTRLTAPAVNHTGRNRCVALLFACLLLLIAPAGASAKVFLELAGVPGESTVSGFEKQIELNSFQLGVSNPLQMGTEQVKGKPSFSALQNSRFTPDALYFYVFDLLAYEGKDLRKLTLRERRDLLETYVLKGMRDPVRLSAVFNATPSKLIAAAKKTGLEGVIAKRAGSRYESGERSGAWVKYKTNQGQELVIGGYKPGTNGFEYLLVGYYEGKDLIFIAKIRNGFTPSLRRDVARNFAGLKTAQCPFANLPEPANARRGEAITAEVMKKIQWLRPKLVAQIEYTEWTKGNHLRHSRFIALRDDKTVSEVIKESS